MFVMGFIDLGFGYDNNINIWGCFGFGIMEELLEENVIGNKVSIGVEVFSVFFGGI